MTTEKFPITIDVPEVHVDVLTATYRCGESIIDMRKDATGWHLEARQFSLPGSASPQKSWQSADADARGFVQKAERRRLAIAEVNKL